MSNNDGSGDTTLELPTIDVVTAPIRPRVGKSPTQLRVVKRTETPNAVINTPNEALQTAALINTPILSAYALTATVLVNGVDIGEPMALEVSTNGFYQADKYFVTLALAALPKEYQEPFWSTGSQRKIELRVKRSGEAYNSLIIGLVDDCSIDLFQRIVTLRGRDLTSLLLDNKTAEKFPNKTASQVAEIIATRRGLSAKISKTSTLVGVYFQREHAKLTMDITEHDLLSFLAEKEGFNYWVSGSTLHFEQQPQADSKPFVISYARPTPSSIANGTFIKLTCNRNETLAKDIEVKVISYQGKKQTAVSASATRSHGTIGGKSAVTRNTYVRPGVSKQLYVYRAEGLSKEQLQARANKIADEISKHERTVICEMPYDPVLDARSRVSLRGTGTDYDQAYFVDSIEYSFSHEAGSRMEIHMRNSSPQSQVSIV